MLRAKSAFMSGLSPSLRAGSFGMVRLTTKNCVIATTTASKILLSVISNWLRKKRLLSTGTGTYKYNTDSLITISLLVSPPKIAETLAALMCKVQPCTLIDNIIEDSPGCADGCEVRTCDFWRNPLTAATCSSWCDNQDGMHVNLSVTRGAAKCIIPLGDRIESSFTARSYPR